MISDINRYNRLLRKHIKSTLVLDINIAARNSINIFLTNLTANGIRYKFESHTKIRIKKEEYYLFVNSLNSIFILEQ